MTNSDWNRDGWDDKDEIATLWVDIGAFAIIWPIDRLDDRKWRRFGATDGPVALVSQEQG